MMALSLEIGGAECDGLCDAAAEFAAVRASVAG